jgi:curved DNA-binding protein CbpA
MTTTNGRDYYSLLEVPPTATLAQIKRAYRRLARKYHPDKNNGDPQAAERFKLIAEAYEVLSDPAQRQRYDRTRPKIHGTEITTPGDDTSDAISAVLRVLETTWQAIRARHPQIPPVVIVIASGTDGRQARWRHHAPQRWRVGLEDRAEIMISGEGLKRGAPAVLGTLLHEAAHALAAVRGIKDTSRQGRYHNKHFKAHAEELGITTEYDQRLGWSVTTVLETTLLSYARQVYDLQNAITLWRHDEHNPGGTTRRSTNLIAAACPCGRSIRIAASTLAEAPVTCRACDGDFTAKDAA